MLLKIVLVATLMSVVALESNGDSASDQLASWAQSPAAQSPPLTTSPSGVPLKSLSASQTVGVHGPILLQDSNFLEHMAKFNRERIPERVVHARGGGAFGTFEVTHNITPLTKAKPFGFIGKKTPVLVRFSTTMDESGAPDTVRDGRGFAVKFYTDDGIWDLAGINFPAFAIRDPILFPSFIHSRKRNPITHVYDPNAFWDFNSLRPETTMNTLLLFSDLGIPDGFRKMDGFGVHAFKLVNGVGNQVYVKFHLRSNQGVVGLDPAEAQHLMGVDRDYAIRDLYNAIAEKRYPSWTLGLQVMTFREAETYRWNPFDVTKLWPFQDFPFVPVGKLTLNRNPTDYFTQIEEVAFSPSQLIPGIEPSPDRMLHGRLFSYPDSQRYRLGVNYLQLPINRPSPSVSIATYQRNGFMCIDDNGAGAPNYFPNSFSGPIVQDKGAVANDTFYVEGADVVRLDVGDDDNYSQPDWYWRTEMTPAVRQRFVDNVAADLVLRIGKDIQARVMTRMFDPVNSDLGNRIRTAIHKMTKILGGKRKDFKK